jgi:hypothetical protein
VHQNHHLVHALGLALALLGSIQAPAIGRADGVAAPPADEHKQRASAQLPTGDDYLTPNFSAGQTYSNVFSILSSRKAEGYDEHAGRNGGSADYTVLSASPTVWRFNSAGRYDGQPTEHHESELRESGRIACSAHADRKDRCEPYLEASGLTYNPILWGVPPKRLVQGMTWKVDMPQAWEMGGKNGVQTVTVMRLDPRTGSVTLSREGSGEGFYSEGDANTVQLNRDGQTVSFDVTPGTSHWKGYTTFVKGVVFNDELTVTRDDVLRGKDGKTVNAATRRIMLLNASPFPTL